MAWQVKALGVKTDDQILIPLTHMGRREVSSDLHMSTIPYVHTSVDSHSHEHTQARKVKFKKF